MEEEPPADDPAPKDEQQTHHREGILGQARPNACSAGARGVAGPDVAWTRYARTGLAMFLTVCWPKNLYVRELGHDLVIHSPRDANASRLG